jgi:hypothetical protein
VFVGPPTHTALSVHVYFRQVGQAMSACLPSMHDMCMFQWVLPALCVYMLVYKHVHTQGKHVHTQGKHVHTQVKGNLDTLPASV